MTANTFNNRQKDDNTNQEWHHGAGTLGHDNWANICKEYNKCKGVSQSPINLASPYYIAPDKDIQFSYTQTSIRIRRVNNTIQFDVDPGSYISINGKKFELIQFHIHVQSEHAIDGKYFPGEIHFVHAHSKEELAVIGIMFDHKKPNELLAALIPLIPLKEETYNSTKKIDLNYVIPENKSHFHYTGSLTTPPCSEIVEWYIFKEGIGISSKNTKRIKSILGYNFRPLQPLNNRKIYVYNI